MFFEIEPRIGGGANGRPGTESESPDAGVGLREDPGETLVDDFARDIAEAADARTIERALAGVLQRLTGFGSARLVPLQQRGLVPGFEAAAIAARQGARVWGWLVVDEPGARSMRVRRRLENLGRITGIALDRVETRTRGDHSSAADRPVGERSTANPAARRGADAPSAEVRRAPSEVHDETFLRAVLPLFFNQAERHKEPFSVLYVAIDRLDAIRALLGADQADQTVRGVGRAIASRIRSSDFVARLNDDRLVVVLPRADIEGALVVARKLSRVVAEEAGLLSEVPELTISIGAASYPSVASSLDELHAAADSALSATRNHGRDRAEAAPRQEPRPQLHSQPRAV